MAGASSDGATGPLEGGPSGAPPSPQPSNAEEFAATYTSLKEVGRGRFGEVSMVQHRVTGGLYALKRTGFGAAGQPDRKKVEMEASALQRLQHENVVRHFASWPEVAHFCILMEFAQHGDFASLLVNRWTTAEAESRKYLDEDEVMSFFVQLADGLSHIHSKKVLHRDLKPENIFVYDDHVLKIGDFGIARCLSQSIELARTVVGSPTYISPEIIHGEPAPRPRTPQRLLPLRLCPTWPHLPDPARGARSPALPRGLGNRRLCAERGASASAHRRAVLVQDGRVVARRHPVQDGLQPVPL